jgi:hypothetical protein
LVRSLALVLLICFSIPQVQSSPTISEIAEPLWKTLLESTMDLPLQIDSLMTSSQQQIDFLANNNGLLNASNGLLTQQNADLQTSLKASQAALATSEEQRKQLGIQLSASISYTIQAQLEAKEMEFELNLWRWIGIGAGGAAIVAILVAVLK